MLKRLIDIVASAVGLVLLSPVIIGIAIATRLTMGPGVIFRQQRPGRGGRIFTMYKFRTMADTKDVSGAHLPEADRLTRFGLFLRRSSMDELPELINVLKGEMSLVGPRPLLVEYLPLYTSQQARRHEVRPGITGWAQVNGRNTLSWQQKFDLDVWYVDNRSLMLDFRILLMTVVKVFGREGISQDEHATVERFEGSRPGDDASRPG